MSAFDKYCISSRVRIARNVKGFPFSYAMTQEESRRLVDMIKGALGNEYTYINFQSLPEAKKNSYVEQHIVSPDLLNADRSTALFMNADKSVAVMVGEEDHIRIQAFSKGNNLKKAAKKAFEAEELIEESVDFMFDERYGYITKCPTNIGTGVRASVMMFLPTTINSRTVSGYSAELARLGMTIRGVFGESSESVGNMYQISNSRTLGMNEDEIIEKVGNIVEALAKREDENEARLLSASENEIKDTAMRSLGLLSSAYMMTNDEAQQLISKVRLGALLGLVNVDTAKLDEAMANSFPNTLSLIAGKELLSPEKRDIYRAEYLKTIFGA